MVYIRPRFFIKKYGGDGASVDNLIISPESLINITGIDPKLHRSFIENGKTAEAYCNSFVVINNDPLEAFQSGTLYNKEKTVEQPEARKSAKATSKKPKMSLEKKIKAAQEKANAHNAQNNSTKKKGVNEL